MTSTNGTGGSSVPPGANSQTVHPDDNPRLAAALWYGSLGWPVFPVFEIVAGTDGTRQCSCGDPRCKHPGKHPRCAHGLNEATTDEQTIRAWWKRWPTANIAMATGERSGTVAIDIDPRNGGDSTLAELEAKHGKLPDTTRALTGGGGGHTLFKHPGGWIKSRNILPGFDCKADGGYIVIEPSNHIDGRNYAWELSSRPGEIPLAPLPPWVMALVTDPPRPEQPPAPADSNAPVVEGGRNSYLASLAGSMRRPGMSEQAILAAIRIANKEKCQPPLDDNEVRKIAASIAGYDPSKPPIVAEWKPPLPLFQGSKPPPFPLDDAFPEALKDFRDFLRGLADELQVPVDLLAALLLAVMAAALSKKYEIEARSGWREIVAIWVLILLESGERKSAGFKRMTEPILEWEKEQAEIIGPELAAAREEREILESERREARKKASKGDGEAKKRAIELAQQLAETEEVLPPTLVTTDATTEALVAVMKSNGERALVASPEADALDVMMGRYDDKARPNMGAWLKGYSGDRVRVHRRGRPPEFLDKPALSLGLTVQPEAVRGMFASPVAKGRGFLARFFPIVPEPMVGRRKIGSPPVEERLEMVYVTTLRKLLEIPLDLAQGPSLIRLSPEALAMCIEFETKVEGALARGGGLSDRKEWGSKLCGGILRIAAVLHCMECFGRPTTRSAASCLEVNAATMRAALSWAPYLVEHERLAASVAGCDPNIAVADRILIWIERGGFEEFSRRDCFDQCRGTLVQRVYDVDAPLAFLIELGYVRPLPPDPAGPAGGRPASPRYVVNPIWRKGGEK